MSEGFMAEPIRPGENLNKTQPGMQSNKSNSAGIIAVVLILCIFVIPLFVFFSIFSKIWDDIKDDVSEAIKNEGTNINLHQNDYALNAKEQKAVARIWGNIYTAKDVKDISLRRGDCRVLKNIATSFTNQNKLAQRWYDSTYCDTTKVDADIEIVSQNSATPGDTFRINLRDVEKKNECVILDFTENFQYLTHVSTFNTCSVSTFSLKADDYNEPEVKPQYTEDQKDEDTETEDDIDNPPIQRS